ncbi:MAG: hypothetical protein WCS43_19015, partial [Verrucomicrobiota bacterium]
MKSTHPNEIRPPGDQPDAIKPTRASHELLGRLAAAALAGFAASVSATPITPNSTVVRGDGKIVATFSTVGSGTWTIPAGVTSVE